MTFNYLYRKHPKAHRDASNKIFTKELNTNIKISSTPHSFLDMVSISRILSGTKPSNHSDVIAQIFWTLVLVLGIRNLDEIWFVLIKIFIECSLFLLGEKEREGAARATDTSKILTLKRAYINEH